MRQERDRLAARRRAQGHTQESLAEILDVAVSTVARWEQGRGRPLPALRRPLAEALSVSLDDLDRLLSTDDGSEEARATAPGGRSTPVPTDVYRQYATRFEPAVGEAMTDLPAEVFCVVYGSTAEGVGIPEDLTVPGQYLGGGYVRVPMDRRTFLVALGGLACMPTAGSATPPFSPVDPDWVDNDLVSSLWRAFEDYSVADWTLGPRHLLAAATGTLGVLGASLHSSQGGRTRDGLLEVGARWAEFGSWLQQDVGAVTDAGSWADRAMEWAQEADDRLMVSYVLVRKSALASMEGDGARTIGLARAAQREHQLPSRVRAVALQQEAYGHALRGDTLACHRRLDQAGELAERGSSDGDDPRDPARYCVPEYVEIQRATCWWLLAQPRRAAESFEQGLAGLPAVHRRDRGVYLARHALASADAGDPEPAATAAGEALRIARDTGSGRILGELKQLRPKLDRWRDLPAVSEVQAMLPGSA